MPITRRRKCIVNTEHESSELVNVNKPTSLTCGCFFLASVARRLYCCKTSSRKRFSAVLISSSLDIFDEQLVGHTNQANQNQTKTRLVTARTVDQKKVSNGLLACTHCYANVLPTNKSMNEYNLKVEQMGELSKTSLTRLVVVVVFVGTKHRVKRLNNGIVGNMRPWKSVHKRYAEYYHTMERIQNGLKPAGYR